MKSQRWGWGYRGLFGFVIGVFFFFLVVMAENIAKCCRLSVGKGKRLMSFPCEERKS